MVRGQLDPETAKATEDKFRNKWWRLTNLYYIMDEEGHKVLFKPNPPQMAFIKEMHYRNIILKARQLGFTTFIQIFMLDAALFNDNVRCGVIAQTLPHAKAFFNDKIKYAYDKIEDWARPMVPKVIKDDALSLGFDNDSSIRVGTSMRSSTLQYLHVSEYGKICKQSPDKAKEVKTGALPAVHQGSFHFIESTAEGRDGHFWELCEKSRILGEQKAAHDEPLGKMDNKFHFFGWWHDPKCQTDQKVVIPDRLAKYFAELKLEYGIELTPQQMRWYTLKEEEQGDDMKQEYPSTWKEAFEAKILGAYYGSQMSYLRREGRLTEVPYEPSVPVNVFWDLGMNDEMALVFHQRIGMSNRIIDYYANSGEGFEHYANVLKEKDYLYGTHYMPHDINVRELGSNGKTRQKVAEGLGIKPIRLVPRAKNQDEVLDGIENVRRFMKTCWIDEVTCDKLIKALDVYRKEWDVKLGTFKKTPLHNWASNPADAMRCGAVGFHQVIEYTQRDLEPELVGD